jgi:PKD repeat protein
MRLGPAAALALSLAVSTLAFPVRASDTKPKKPSLSMRANPNVGFAPLRVVFTVDLRGGPNDYEEYYCPSIQWDWGDDTESQDSPDCDPYVAGKSEIKRTYTAEHKYVYGGEYTVNFRLKRGDKVLTSTSTVLRIRPGLRDIGD